jgi:hypothetical protein
METGNVVIFRKNSGLISKAISFITSSSYTHAGIIYYVGNNEVITAEAQAQGFVLIKRSKEEFSQLMDSRDITVLQSRYKLVDDAR